ncbi:hypothetical protein FDK38_000437 [Candidozyma auris]|nr:hypothetical protein FDK38_000437 [[Candida] auris]
MFTLAIGDLYIPDRSSGIPQKFLKLLAPNSNAYPSNPKISQVVCLGNITQSKETLQYLYNISPSFHIVQGEFDDPSVVSQQLEHISGSPSNLPQYKVITADNFRIGFTNGHQIMPQNDPLSLLAFAREINVDILIWGGTHRVEAYTLDGKYFINPGSASGAFHFGWPEIDDIEEEEEDVDDDNEEGMTEEKVDEKTEKSSEVDGQDKKESQEELADKEENSSNSKKEENNENDGKLNDPIPSFCLLETNGSRCTLYIYTYINNEVKVDKVIYQKD